MDVSVGQDFRYQLKLLSSLSLSSCSTETRLSDMSLQCNAVTFTPDCAVWVPISCFVPNGAYPSWGMGCSGSLSECEIVTSINHAGESYLFTFLTPRGRSSAHACFLQLAASLKKETACGEVGR
jgi:hypothetical protein